MCEVVDPSTVTRFLTSTHLLQDKLGSRLGTANLEVVSHSRVIDGKTGAPQVELIRVW